MVKEIKILGPGCQKCDLLYENVIKAVEELNMNIDIIKVRDLIQITAHGVITTPALVIDGKIVSQGRILSVEEIKELLR